MEFVRAEALTSDSARSGTATTDSVIVSNSVPVAAPTSRAVPPRTATCVVSSDETLVPDLRAEVTPAQCVERRLASLLKDAAVPASHVRLASHLTRKS